MIPEQEALINKAKESLKAAKILNKDRLFDFAISRAYYAMFYVAEAFLLKKDLTFSKHSAVISAIGNKFVRSGEMPKKFHKNLLESFNNRAIGDYNTETGFTEQDGKEEITKAEEFVKFAEENL